MRSRLLLVLVLVPVLAAPLSAGIIFGKKGKPTPAERVPELLGIAKADGDENKRSAAVEELRQYDPAQFPDIIPTLIDVLQNDKKPGVRAEAAQTLGKLRPVSQQVGMALEQSLAKDPSMRVRLQARSALLSYHWAGYHGGKKEDTPPQSKEPPLAGPPTPLPPMSPTPVPPPSGSRVAPPLTPPPVVSPPPTTPPAPSPPPPMIETNPTVRPLPVGPATVPATPPKQEGPELPPPQ
jgi:hypothetical protein